MLSREQGGVPHVFGWMEGCWIAQWEGGLLHNVPCPCLRSVDRGLFPSDSADNEAKLHLTFWCERISINVGSEMSNMLQTTADHIHCLLLQ